MANVLKRNFEAHFCVESQAPGKKYDLQRLLDKVRAFFQSYLFAAPALSHSIFYIIIQDRNLS
jgi:hypothetical protein